jgi:hypothetical protein
VALRLLVGWIVLAALCACSDSRHAAARKITPAEAKELRLQAARFYLDFRGRGAPEYVSLKPSLWPEAFKKLRPLRVGIYIDGVALAMEGNAATEQGIHIVPIAMDLMKPRGSVHYEKIQDGVYWYRLGK